MARAGYDRAEQSNLSKGQVFAFAESIAKQLDFKPGDDIHDLVVRLGGTVTVEDTLTEDPERSGSLYVENPQKFAIIVPAHTSRLRDRFTIAHELGHFMVHYMWRRHNGTVSGRPMMALRKGSDRIEWEANWFAAGFLMPETEFKEAFEKFSGSLPDIAEAFEVSMSAAQVRASQLGLT